MKQTQEDLIKKLAVFGFTSNQAKVYLTIVRAGSISVSKIAESSKLYRQDIYKILPKLEKKGLITKTLGTPIIVKAVPVKQALKGLVSMERKKALERITRMEAKMKELSNAVSMQYEIGTEAEPESPHFSLLTQENEIENRASLLFERAKIECNIVASLEILIARGTKLREQFQTAINNGAKIRLIVEAPRRDEQIKSAIDRVRPDKNNFRAKLIISKSPKPFQIVDREEVWISTTLKSPSGIPGVLWSNGKNIVATYQERFERMWNDHSAIALLPVESAKQKPPKRLAAT